MDSAAAGICIRCGKVRKIVKEWEEVEHSSWGDSTLYFSQYACPDNDCQLEVDKELSKRKELSDEREARFEERQAARSRGNAAPKA